MSKFFLPKTPHGTINFSVMRENGDRLSFASDDSCGASKTEYVRTYLQLMDQAGTDLQPEDSAITPVEYLHALAHFLGYNVVPKES